MRLATRLALVILTLNPLFAASPPATAADPLPSWNDTATKRAILGFVDRVTDETAPDFVPIAERIAVFDMDGTLIPERPIPEAIIPMFDDLKKAVAKNPALGDRPAIAAFLKGDIHGVLAAGEQGMAEIIAAVTDGRTVEEAA